MRVFLAGATGAVGPPLLARLLAACHDVTATSRSPEKAVSLTSARARGIALDAFDEAAVRAAVAEAKPEIVVHQLTALPSEPSARTMKAALGETGRLRSRPALLSPAAGSLSRPTFEV